MTIRMACFDLGGVVVRICRSFEEGVRAAGLEARPGAARVIESSRERRRALTDLHQTGRLGSREYFRLVSDELGRLYDEGEVERIHHAWLLGEYEGVGALLDDLGRAPGLRTGVLSNTNDAHWRVMMRDERFPSLRRVGHPHASHLLGLAKPGRAIYEAFERAAACAPNEVAFFDDLEENVRAAEARGWRATRIDPLGDTASQVRASLHALGVVLTPDRARR